MASINFITWWNKNKDRIKDEVLSHQWSYVYKYTQEAWENGYLTAQRKAQPEDSTDNRYDPNGCRCDKCGSIHPTPSESLNCCR